MADTADKKKAPASAEESMPAPTMPTVTAQEAKTVGDENMPAPREPGIEVVQETVPAQVVQPREGDSDVVHVHETSITLDEVITDPSSPLAVQIPDAGRGSLELPIHGLAGGTVEAYFREHASKLTD